MQLLVRMLYLVPGLVNFVPVLGVLGADRLEALYGQQFAGPDILLLLQHRAVLFGVLGALLMVAAFRSQLRGVATTAGLVSMISYVLLALPLSNHSAAIQRVFWADVICIVLLIAGSIISARTQRRVD
jgi:hypothetical protein